MVLVDGLGGKPAANKAVAVSWNIVSKNPTLV